MENHFKESNQKSYNHFFKIVSGKGDQRAESLLEMQGDAMEAAGSHAVGAEFLNAGRDNAADALREHPTAEIFHSTASLRFKLRGSVHSYQEAVAAGEQCQVEAVYC
ncbi:unnamed protein product [Polarella glacialis]|uniref:Uncharacterized protein n=1 Tax=Polarella glacialis TaxID=89957 RepID=A0A813GSJ9_POLGL|nr:unnamed protein product [Polarella glacialis]